MRSRRLLATTALLATALTLSLSACGPDNTTAAGASKGTSASPSATAIPSPTTAPSATPTASPSPSTAAPTTAPTAKTDPIALPSTQPTAKPVPKPTTAKPAPANTNPAKPTPTPDCTANAYKPGHKVINATVAWGDPNRIGANATKFECGPDIENDGIYLPTAPNTGYTFAPGATATVVGKYASQDPKSVSLTDLLTHINYCTQNPTGQDPYGCYRNMYDITTNSAGQITSINELYHP
ncbi:hypothetical protein [Kitasatospora kifunensis]|uniref:Lipoprotein n=1 Tax=Kitasatospora kifunensis TaxID=58351 RepID=A0A7W7VVM0_KITKI|nr:hypothetical protein [Kitasatospora kifunensis]MBB4924043.1 hypothetical protein [Kitasatospora kifunensis]